MQEKIAVFPGSFDPITLGHCDILIRALPLFDKIIIAVGKNTEKKYMFPLQMRETWIKESFAGQKKIRVESYDGLTVDFCRKKMANFILRGLRNPADFEFEKAIAYTNRKLTNDDIETVFLLTSSEKSYISSSIVRDVIKNKGKYNSLVPPSVKI